MFAYRLKLAYNYNKYILYRGEKMYRKSKETRKIAWEILRKHYWGVFAFTIIAILISGANIVGLILGGPILVGAAYMMLRTLREDNSSNLEYLFKEFDDFGRTLGVHLLSMIKIFLWSLLFVIPGIVRSYSLSQVYFITKENPDLSVTEIQQRSTEMMRGHKFRLFKLHFSFIGWVILCILTFGIGSIFLLPYVKTAEGVFYEELINQNPQYKKNPDMEIFE